VIWARGRHYAVAVPATPASVILDRYALMTPIGSGGMATVWAAMDTRLGRKVVVKQIRPHLSGDPDAVRRFHREAQVTARLTHPGIPVLYDFGSASGELFIVMEHVDGITIADLLDEVDPVPVPWAAAIAAQVCAVLAAAHARLLVHRDIKPSNVMISPDGSVKVLDFGLAAALTKDEFPQITQTGQLPGTPFYMAPEVAAGAQATPASDLYSTGCLLYELLTGQVVFADLDPHPDHAHLSRRPAPVRARRPGVPAGLDALTVELLSLAPAGRPHAGTAFARLLPFAAGVPPLPGIVADPAAPSPAQMYAIVQERVTRP
jgi:eukaryotic-like serine/threonine-protein kinase